MKNRFLITGLIALMVGACGDDVQIVEPTPPPTPPVTASMAPASAEVAVGNSVVFAVNASGGAAGAAATWTCASSNTGIATASTMSAGCQATGVAAGGVTITAVVTKGSETVNVGSQLTVTSDDGPTQPTGQPAFILISGINNSQGATAEMPITGTVSVLVNVERGDQTLAHLDLLVDGEVVALQLFGAAMTPADDDEAAEQAVHTFSFSLDTDGYDAETGAPDYANGEHTISAELSVVGGMDVISSNGIPVEFGNEDGVHVALSGLGAGAMNSQTGQVWYGGPAANLEITAVPVLYSGGSGASVTLLTFCGADAATDSAAPFAFTPNCGKAKWVTSADDGDTPEFNIAGAVVETLNVDAFYLDYQAPSAPTFYPNPNDREGGWVNATVDFLGKQGSKNKDGWLMYNEDGANAGVGGYTAALRAAAAPSGGDGLEEAVAAPLLTLATLSGESKANAYCVVASAVDALGNESALPDPDDDECMTAADILATGMEAVEADMDANPPVEAMDAVPVTQMSAMRAGVDLTPPTAVFTGASLGEDAKSLNELTGGETTARQYQLHVTDNRGLRVAEPVVDTLEIRDDDGDIDGVAARTELEAEGSPLVNVQFAEDGVGYYTYTGQAQDMAGNLSEPVSRVALHDTSVPVSALIFARGKDAFNYDKTLVAADNLSIRDYSVVIEGPNDLPAPVRLKRAMIDGYNGDLTQTKTVSGPVELPFIAVSTSTNGSVAEGAVITAFTAHVTDQAGNASLGRESVAITVDTNDGGDGDVDSDEGTVVGEYALTVEDDDGAITADNTVAKSDETITLTVTATLAIGTTANPFADVHFFAEVTGINTELASETTDPRSELRQIGTVDGINAELKTGIERVWTFETEISADDYYAIVGGATSSNEIHALGVNGNGVAHALSFTPALVIGKR